MPETPPDYFCTHCRPDKFDQRTMCRCPCYEENNEVPMFLIGICLLLAIGLFTVYLSDLDWKIGGIIGFSIALFIGITYTLIWEFNSCWAKMRMHVWVPEIPPYVVCRVCGKRKRKEIEIDDGHAKPLSIGYTVVVVFFVILVLIAMFGLFFLLTGYKI